MTRCTCRRAQVAEEAGNDVEVVLLEKQPKLGGNSAKASSGINALTETAGDKVQLFVNDTLVSGGGRSRPELVERLVVGPSLQCCLRSH